MLWPESDHWRFAHQIRQIFFVSRWKAIVSTREDVIQLIERIAARTPRLALLVRDEEIPEPVEGQRVGYPDASGDRLQLLCVSMPFLDCAPHAIHVVMRHAVLHAIGVRVVSREQPEIDIALFIQRYRGSVHASRGHVRRGPTFCDDFFRVRLAVAVCVPEERNLSL